MLSIRESGSDVDVTAPFKAMLAELPPGAPVRIAFAPSAAGGDIDLDAGVDHMSVRWLGGGIEVCITLSGDPLGADDPCAGELAMLIARIWHSVIPGNAMCRRVIEKLEALEGARPSIILD